MGGKKCRHDVHSGGTLLIVSRMPRTIPALALDKYHLREPVIILGLFRHLLSGVSTAGSKLS